jgi:mono/diheme cytochrome c family protein
VITRLASFGIFGFLLSGICEGQDLAAQGEQVFRQSCAQGYCHGSGGTQGRAPKLIGRNFDAAFVDRVVKQGVPNTGMPAFGSMLASDKLQAVIFYVLKISGADTSSFSAMAGAGAPVQQMPAEARQGKELFFDAVRGLKRCGTCHALEGWGTAVGPNLATGERHTAQSIRSVRSSGVRTARVGSDSFPAMPVERNDRAVRIYDLTTLPPVLRTLAPGDVSLSGVEWNHAPAVSNYTDTELSAIAGYLAWLSR